MLRRTNRCLIAVVLLTAGTGATGCGSNPPARDAGAGTESTRTPMSQVADRMPVPRTPEDQFDVLSDERGECRDLFDKLLSERALECSQTLWLEHASDMSDRGRIDLLELMGEIYSSTENFEEAKFCYKRILQIHRWWLPEYFDQYPSSWRVPIIEAYSELGYGKRPAGYWNLALLDFVIGDTSPDEVNLSLAEKSLADLITAYLQSTVSGAAAEGDAGPLRFVSYRERTQLLAEMAKSWGQDPSRSVNADMVDASVLARAGQIQAVQAFLQGSITRIHDNVSIAFYIIRVETGFIDCSATRQGSLDELYELIHVTLSECLSCAIEGMQLPQESGLEELGPMAKATVALKIYHEALARFEAEDYSEALDLAQTAQELRPGVPEFVQLVEDISFARRRLELTQAMNLPAPILTSN